MANATTKAKLIAAGAFSIVAAAISVISLALIGEGPQTMGLGLVTWMLAPYVIVFLCMPMFRNERQASFLVAAAASIALVALAIYVGGAVWPSSYLGMAFAITPLVQLLIIVLVVVVTLIERTT